MEELVLGGGCFWCLEAVFNKLTGVEEVQSGYTGGKFPNPTYREICSGLSGHAEVIKIRYDKQQISLETLLELFFTFHDPTTLNRQGNDVGTQYRSVIYYSNDEQRKAAEDAMAEATKIWDKQIVTEVSLIKEFYKAEDYHQNYYENNTNKGYCQVVISPKVTKLREKYKHLMK